MLAQRVRDSVEAGLAYRQAIRVELPMCGRLPFGVVSAVPSPGRDELPPVSRAAIRNVNPAGVRVVMQLDIANPH